MNMLTPFLNNKIAIFWMAAAIAIPTLSTAQRAGNPDDIYWSSEENLGGPVFRFKTYQRLTSNQDETVLDIYIKIANDMLQFVRNDLLFEASLEFAVSIHDDDEKLVVRRINYLNHKVESFGLTNSRKDYVLGSLSTKLPPGKYHITVSLTDQESKRQLTNNRSVTINPTAENLDLSDLILTNSTELMAENNAPLYPLVTGKIIDPDASLYCFFDLLRSEPMEETLLELKVFNTARKEIYKDSTIVIGGENQASYFLPVYGDQMSFGKYQLIVKAIQLNQEVERQTEFKINYFGLPTSIEDVDLAIRQLTIIAEGKDIARLEKLPESKKEKELVNYWDEHFPSPGEAVNGKMIEYYQRVTRSNIRFGNGYDGWRTDRGRILIMYGEPTNIERQSVLDNSVPVEIWFYDHLSKRFVFRDEHGFGDYRLVNQLW